MDKFIVGDVVKCKKFGPMDHSFTGVVEKIYTNSMMVSIQDFNKNDKSGVNELNGRAVVAFSEAKMVKAAPRDPKKEAEKAAEEEKKTTRGRKRTKSSAKKKTTKSKSSSKAKKSTKSTKKADK